MAKSPSPTQSLEDVLSNLGDLPGLIGNLGQIVDRMVQAIVPLVDAISKLSILGNAGSNAAANSQVGQSQTLLVAATDRNVVASYRLASVMERLIAVITKTAQVALPQGAVAPPGGGSGATEVGGSFAQLAKIGAVAAAALAVVAIAASLAEKEFHKLESFVRLFNPAVIDIFHQALNNLGATIGRAFVPLFQDATQVVRQYTAALAPVIQKLVPIIQQFADAFGNIAVASLRVFAGVIQSALPIFKQFAQFGLLLVNTLALVAAAYAPLIRGFLVLANVFYELTGLGVIVRVLTKVMEAFTSVFQVLEEAFTIFETVFQSIIDTISAVIAPFFSLQGIMNALTQAIQLAIRNMYVFAISLLRLAGLNDAADAVLKSIADRANATGDTAAQTPAIKGLEQLSKDLSLAAASAGGAAGGGGVNSQQEFWRATLKAANTQATNIGNLATAINNLVNAILNPVGTARAAAGATLGAATSAAATGYRTVRAVRASLGI